MPDAPKTPATTRRRWIGWTVLLGGIAVTVAAVWLAREDRRQTSARLAAEARVALLAGRFEAASRAFAAAISADPALARVPHLIFWTDYIESLIRQGRGPEARQILLTRLAIGADAVLLDRLGVVEAQEGRDEHAEALWIDANRLDPGLAHPMLALGRIALARGRLDTAISYLERAAAIDADDPEIPYALSLAYRSAGRTDDAERSRTRAEAARSRAPARAGGMDVMP